MNELATRLGVLRLSLSAACQAAGRGDDEVRLVAVSKGHGADAIRAGYALGLRDFGENYAVELREKREALKDLPDIRWHFIGRVQRGNAKPIATCALVHGVGSLDQAQSLAKKRTPADPLPVLLQLNLEMQETKNGFSAEEVEAELPALLALPGLRVRGFMAIPPPEVPAGPAFLRVRALRDRLAPTLPELSMGMSDDFTAAIAAGSTLVRIGTALFGPRPKVRPRPLVDPSGDGLPEV